MCNIHTGSGAVTYDAVRSTMDGEIYTMSLTDTAEIKAVIAAVNRGIDSHLKRATALVVVTVTRAAGGWRASWSCAEPWSAVSVLNHCPSCFVASMNWTPPRTSWTPP